MRGELDLWRRHSSDCAHRAKGRSYIKCSCPVWCDGYIDGERIRESLGTRNWERAIGKADRLAHPEETPAKREVPIAGAIGAYLDDCRARHLAPSTIRSYSKTLGHFEEFCRHEAYSSMQSLTLETFMLFRGARRGRDKRSQLTASTQRKEIECLRGFCAFSKEHRWIEENWAKKLRPPKESVLPTLPFTQEEIKRIVAATGTLENNNSDSAAAARTRARALVLLLLYSGLRISDAAKLSRGSLDRSSGRLLLRVMKTGRPLYIRLSVEAIAALDKLGQAGPNFFWSGKSKLSTIVGSLRRTLVAVGRKTKTDNLPAINVHPHRFRDTFAVSLLEEDVPIRTVQLLLGHSSVRTTEKHYAPFVESQQRLLDDAVAKLDFRSASAGLRKSPHNTLKDSLGDPQRHVRASPA